MGYHFVAFCSRRTRLVTVHPEPALVTGAIEEGKFLYPFVNSCLCTMMPPKYCFRRIMTCEGPLNQWSFGWEFAA